MPKRIKRKLDDQHISALLDFDQFGIVWDTQVHGLRLRVGPRKATWQFFQEHSIHGNRSATHKTLGFYPSMSTVAARKLALVEAGRIADNHVTPGKKAAVRLGAALDDYEKFLRNQSAKGGKGAKKGSPPKPARHADNVVKLRKLHLAEFERWPLADLSDYPKIMKEWHEKVTREAGPVTANRAAEVVRACYRHQRKSNRSLPPDMPTSGIQFNTEAPSEKALAPKAFPKWRAAWEKIESPIRRSYHLFCLLTGMRPGEAARLTWANLLPRERRMILGNAKAANDIRIPLSIPIVKALRMARDAGDDETEPLIFPGCAQVGHRDKLPARGNVLRHTYRTVAAECKVDEMLSHFLLGHAPAGISQKYVARMILSAGPAMRSAQREISAKIMS